MLIETNKKIQGYKEMNFSPAHEDSIFLRSWSTNFSQINSERKKSSNFGENDIFIQHLNVSKFEDSDITHYILPQLRSSSITRDRWNHINVKIVWTITPVTRLIKNIFKDCSPFLSLSERCISQALIVKRSQTNPGNSGMMTILILL